MKTTLSLILLGSVLGLAIAGSGLRGFIPDKYPAMKNTGVDPGKPLFLTPYIEKKQFELGKRIHMFLIEAVKQNLFSCRKMTLIKILKSFDLLYEKKQHFAYMQKHLLRGADQLHPYRAADQHLCFHCI